MIMRNLFTRLFLTLVLLALPIFVVAQTSNQTITEPFKPGETFTYEGRVSRAKIFGLTVAELTFKIDQLPDSQSKKYVFKTETSSKNSLLKLFGFSFLQKYETTVETEPSFRVLKTVKYDQQRNRIRNSESIFDYTAKKVTYTESDPKNPTAQPRKIAAEIGDQVQDIVSALYYLRFLPLAVDKSFTIPVSDFGMVYKIPVKVTKREILKTSIGKVWTFKLEPDIFGPNKLIEEKGKMIIWITDDKRRIIVKSQIQASIGTLDVKIKKASGLTEEK